MKLKTALSVIITLLLVLAVGIYLIALDNRYKQIYGKDYFDIWTGKTVKAAPLSPREIIVEYPLLKAQYKVEDNPEPLSSK